jgi:hypothetical protein
MTGTAVQRFGTNRRPLPHLGERVRSFLAPLGLTEKELAIRANIDVRTARSAKEGSCGPATFDALAEAFQWEFIEAVMTPVVGADPLTAREAQLERHMAEAAAIQARLERERAVRARHRAGMPDPYPASALRGVQLGRTSGSEDQPPTEGA